MLGTARGTLGPWIAGVALAASGTLLLIGFATPFAALVAALGASAAALGWLPPSSLASSGSFIWLLAVSAAALGPLGPGAFSVDARLFGRREISLPRAQRDL
jgi:uncharacterized membrane protein YphA (DoxX/SURF4 family)